MSASFSRSFTIEGRDFLNAGRASTQIKTILKELSVDPAIIRRVAIASYEAEMNVVMYATRAKLKFTMSASAINLEIDDEGPGIPDITLAMQEGYSTATSQMRELGFGAGMGLPNMKKNSDEFVIESAVSKGTRLTMTIYIN
ncbi:MAG: ATP-binding protein [Ignavibacteriae bacterium]|nr:ATP-binding protein [Ignavibacteriota bacterium]